MDFLLGLGACFAWAALWAVAAGLATFFSIVAATVLEQKLLVREERTFLLWIVALALCPVVAFAAEWTLCGLVLAERYYAAVRFGGLAAGMAYVLVGVLFVMRPGERTDRKDETVTLIVSAATDLLCCAALVWQFEPISRYMSGLGA